MRRTGARQVTPFAGTLAQTACSVCAQLGVVILASGRNDNGLIERQYCSMACAKAEGWPWLNGDGWRRAS
jgi:hypothetical protein